MLSLVPSTLKYRSVACRTSSLLNNSHIIERVRFPPVDTSVNVLNSCTLSSLKLWSTVIFWLNYLPKFWHWFSFPIKGDDVKFYRFTVSIIHSTCLLSVLYLRTTHSNSMRSLLMSSWWTLSTHSRKCWMWRSCNHHIWKIPLLSFCERMSGVLYLYLDLPHTTPLLVTSIHVL